VGIEFNKLYNSQMRTEAELKAFSMAISRERCSLDERENYNTLTQGYFE
jgi:hypothetical protein